MKKWIGKSIMIIGAIHSLIGIVMFHPMLAEIIEEGIFNTVNGQVLRELAFWFIIFGYLAIIFGLLIDWCERREIKLPGFLGWNLLALTLLIVIIMPISGGWFLLAPAIGAILRSESSKNLQT
jgi:hypothetical protein